LPKDRVTVANGLEADVSGAAPFLLEAAHWVTGGRVAPTDDVSVGGPPPSASTAPSGPTSPARVLVADDNADMRDYLVRLLAPRWTVEAFGDGRAAFESALERPPDLVLSDVMMPGMDGVGLLRALRANAKTSTIPVLLLSARAGEDAIVTGLETGADDYLVKPFSARELLSRVGTHLEMARVRRAATAAATELAETRAELLEDLNRKNKDLEAFSYSISHDLRAPLRCINGFSQALQEDHGDQLGPDGQDQLRQVRSAAQRMGELIDDLLMLSRVERTELRCAVFDLSRLARSVGDRLAKSSSDRAVELIVEDGLVAEADARLVEILLENVLGNAWKFTAKTTCPRVELGLRHTDGHPSFFVKDNGAGFDQAYAERLFTPFQRLHSVGEFPGTGIGLATVGRIVDRHSGRIWAEGKVDLGATVSWTLPPPKRRRHVE
jgi:signal transduction histidine kinase